MRDLTFVIDNQQQTRLPSIETINKVKDKQCYTVRTVLESNRKIADRGKIDTPNITAHFPGLIGAPIKNVEPHCIL
jgi:hypothetical protein